VRRASHRRSIITTVEMLRKLSIIFPSGKHRPRPSDRWHLDEMVVRMVRIAGTRGVLCPVAASWQRTMAKVGKSDGEGTFAGVRGNDQVALITDLYAAAGERGASNFAGDSATAERSAGQHAHPQRACCLVNRCVSARS